MNWLAFARQEMRKNVDREGTAVTANRTLTTVTAVPSSAISEISTTKIEPENINKGEDSTDAPIEEASIRTEAVDFLESEIMENAFPPTAVTADRTLTAVKAVPGPGDSGKFTGSAISSTNDVCIGQTDRLQDAGPDRAPIVRLLNGDSVSSRYPYVLKRRDGTYEGCWIDRPGEIIVASDEVDVVNQLYDSRLKDNRDARTKTPTNFRETPQGALSLLSIEL